MTTTQSSLSQIEATYTEKPQDELRHLKQRRAQIDEDIADMTRTVNRIGDTSDLGWLDPRIDLIDADILFWQSILDQIIARLRVLKAERAAA